MQTFLLSVLIFTCYFEIYGFSSAENEKQYCLTLNNEVKCENLSNIKLSRLDGHESGHIENIRIEDGRQLEMKTLSLKPLILEISNFLTKEECKRLKEMAIEEGLQSSETHNWDNSNRFILQDKDNDKRLNLEEMKLTLMGGFDVHLNKEDILLMYKEIKIDKDNDEYITQSEMSSFSPKHFERYLNTFLKTHPEKHSRYSRQVWLKPDTSDDEVFNRIINRASTWVDLPVELLKLSDFQVVNYDIKGHYHAHWDSSGLDKAALCCDKVRKNNCRICRYMTIFFYLNDVKDGGGTAFPVANNETVNLEEITKQELYNLNEKCGLPGLKVTAEMGKAIIWYNHFVNQTSGWLGEQDRHTYHGGCPVKKGEKWVANFWIKVTDDKEDDLAKMHKYQQLLSKKKKKKGKDEL